MARGHVVPIAASISVLLAAALAVGCRPQVGFHAAWPDVQVELRDDADRDQAIDQLWVMPPGAERDRVRDRIGAAIARRITDAIDDDQPFVAAALLDQLTGMWQADPADAATESRSFANMLFASQSGNETLSVFGNRCSG